MQNLMIYAYTCVPFNSGRSDIAGQLGKPPQCAGAREVKVRDGNVPVPSHMYWRERYARF